MEAATKDKDKNTPVDEGHEAVKRVGQSRGNPTPQDVQSATDWFLSDADTGDPATKTFSLNVGRNRDRYVDWTVQAITREKIREIRRMSRPARSRAAEGSVDEMIANLGIAAAGTIVPDLGEIAEKLNDPDPANVLRLRLKHKPGLIDQIAAEVMSVSGYDDDDIRDVAAGKP